MKLFTKIAQAVEKGITLIKFFECLNAGLTAFVEKAKANGLYKEESNVSTNSSNITNP